MIALIYEDWPMFGVRVHLSTIQIWVAGLMLVVAGWRGWSVHLLAATVHVQVILIVVGL